MLCPCVCRGIELAQYGCMGILQFTVSLAAPPSVPTQGTEDAVPPLGRQLQVPLTAPLDINSMPSPHLGG